jgi:hypothetical protein
MDIDLLFEKSIKENYQRHKLLFDLGLDFGEYKNFLPEGITIDFHNFTVSYDPNTENYVQTSVENNPALNKGFGNTPVWSIFKRKKASSNDKFDGNPLLYAFKHEKGWRFKTQNDKESIVNQIRNIIDKFNKTHKYGVTVIIPSGGPLNNFIANLIKEKKPNTKIVDDLLWKITTDEVLNHVMTPNSKFRQYYRGKENFNNAITRLERYLTIMDEERDGNFTYHFIDDNNMRSVIEKTMILSNNMGKYSNDINGKDIIIVDDSISQGKSVKEACNLIKKTFIPKSMIVLTLFSKL